MEALLRRFLTSKQDRTLLNLRKPHGAQKVIDRAEVIKLKLAAAREEIDLKYLDESGFVHGANLIVSNKGLFDLYQSC